MLHLSVSALKEGTVGASEAEVLDILWALEEMPLFKQCEIEIAAEKASKKEAKSEEKKSKKDSKKKDKKGKDKDKGDKDKKEKVVLSTDAKAFKELLKENGDKFKDTLKYSRKSKWAELIPVIIFIPLRSGRCFYSVVTPSVIYHSDEREERHHHISAHGYA